MFASKEEKERRRQEYIAQQEEKDRQTLHILGLDLDECSEADIIFHNASDIRSVNAKLAGSGLEEFGSLLQGKTDTSKIIGLMRALITQNWIAIRQNEQIIRELKKLNEKD